MENGTRLGPYEIVSPLGAGGMGEVYRARDTRLDREVAVKVLPAELSEDEEVRQRFEREAKTISSLSHPHICTLHDIGREDGVDFLVMELLEGESLADRLGRGALPRDEALRIAIEVADALGQAHKLGVVHRDLKPANIMLTRSGAKLLDFGLARSTGLGASPSTASSSPTVAQPLTSQGMILGTLQYMAPEQLEGGEAEAVSDIFSFGALLHEMVSGHKAFAADTQASAIAGILERHPPLLSELAPNVDPALSHLVSACLEKDPEERWQSASDLRMELEWIRATEVVTESASTASSAPGGKWGSAVAGAVIGALIVGVGAALLSVGRGSVAVEAEPARLAIPYPSGRDVLTSRPVLDGSNVLALSTDGRDLVFVRSSGSSTELAVRPIGELAAVGIRGTEGALSPFFSPDGTWLGFFADGALRKVEVGGGAPVTLARFPAGGATATWGADGTIVVGGARGLYRVADAGGDPTMVTAVDEDAGQVLHTSPQILPDGGHVLFSIWEGSRTHRIAVVPLAGGEICIVGDGAAPHYLPTGHLVFVRDAAVWAAPFDPAVHELPTAPVPVLSDDAISVGGVAQLAIAVEGTLVYVPASALDITPEGSLAWVARDGTQSVLGDDEAMRKGAFPRISPEGGRVAVTLASEDGDDIWVIDLERGASTRVTTEGTSNRRAIWSPDGARLAFSSNLTPTVGIHWKGADGSGSTERLFPSVIENHPFSFSPNGEEIAYYAISSETGRDIWVGRPGGDAQPFLATRFSERSPIFSPAGGWIAYVSDESGRDEVYVQAYPGPGGRQLISTEGGREPVWSRDGGELFFRNGDQMMAVDVTLAGGAFRAGTPRVLFEQLFASDPWGNPNYDVAADGRFLMVGGDSGAATTWFQVYLGWLDELARRLPTGQ
ncbi:MAG: protein kinase [Acidobacteriota bacterium]|nr:protein kinase [Acidobacteriota bacterium]